MQDSIAAQPITLSKLNRPRLSGQPVHRARLLAQLDPPASIILVTAPAGYGKTVLLSTWLESCRLPSGWLSLDPQDNDVVVFATYLVAAVRTLFPDACSDTLELLQGINTPPVAVVSRSMSNDLSALPNEFVLVLDDYHVIHDAGIHALMTALTRHPPRQLHLVLAARSDPALPLSGLRARGNVVEIREADLRFTGEETASLLRDDMRLEVDDQTVADLQSNTEGWAAGLRLAALYLRHTGDLASLAVDRGGSNRYIISYLLAEVLAHVPGTVQQFLLKSSILDRFCAPLCEAVTGMDDAACEGGSCLAWLERNNLFIRSVDQEQRWFHYHHLFQRLLIDQLEQQHGRATVRALHLKASAWFAENGYPEDALRQALAAGDVPAAVQIVAQYRRELMNGEQWHRMERWLRLFQPEAIDAQPELLVSQAWLMRIHHHLSEMAALLDRAEGLIGHLVLDPANANRLRGEIDANRATQYFYAAEHRLSFAAAQRALERLPADWWHMRAHARLFLSGGYLMQGELTQAYATLYNSGELDQSRASRMRMLAEACIIHSMAGDLTGTAQAATRVLEGADPAGSQIETTTWAGYHLGICYYERNNLAEAKRYLAPIVAQPYQAHLSCSLNAAVALAMICHMQGQPDKAGEIADQMITLALETKSAGALAVAKGLQAEVALRQGRLAAASEWAEQFAGPLTTPKPFFYYAPFTLVRILIAQDTSAGRQRAGEILATLSDYFVSIHLASAQMEVLALQALLYDISGDRAAALDALAGALALAEPGEYVRPFLALGQRLERLLTMLVQQRPPMHYATRVLAAFPQTPAGSDGRGPSDIASLSPLTLREVEVLALLQEHLSDKEIAQRLVISVTTVRSHIEHIGDKLGVHGRRAIIEIARSRGLIKT